MGFHQKLGKVCDISMYSVMGRVRRFNPPGGSLEVGKN